MIFDLYLEWLVGSGWKILAAAAVFDLMVVVVFGVVRLISSDDV